MTDVDRVLASFQRLAEQLAVLAFRSGHETGDLARHDDAGELWNGYWEQVYGPMFASAYLAIAAAIRRDLRVRRLPDRGAEWFFDAIRRLETRRARALPSAPKRLAPQVRDLERRVRADRPRLSRRRTAIPTGHIDATGLPGLAIGDGLETAFALFGEPASSTTFASREFPVWPRFGLQLGVCRPGYVVTAISAFWDKPAFARATSAALAKTFRPAPVRARGELGPGASARAIRAAYGPPTFDHRWKEGGRVLRSLGYGDLRFELVSDAAVLVAIGA